MFDQVGQPEHAAQAVGVGLDVRDEDDAVGVVQSDQEAVGPAKAGRGRVPSYTPGRRCDCAHKCSILHQPVRASVRGDRKGEAKSSRPELPILGGVPGSLGEGSAGPIAVPVAGL